MHLMTTPCVYSWLSMWVLTQITWSSIDVWLFSQLSYRGMEGEEWPQWKLCKPFHIEICSSEGIQFCENAYYFHQLMCCGSRWVINYASQLHLKCWFEVLSGATTNQLFWLWTLPPPLCWAVYKGSSEGRLHWLCKLYLDKIIWV